MVVSDPGAGNKTTVVELNTWTRLLVPTDCTAHCFRSLPSGVHAVLDDSLCRLILYTSRLLFFELSLFRLATWQDVDPLRIKPQHAHSFRTHLHLNLTVVELRSCPVQDSLTIGTSLSHENQASEIRFHISNEQTQKLYANEHFSRALVVLVRYVRINPAIELFPIACPVFVPATMFKTCLALYVSEELFASHSRIS